jgi:hypothetical protein
MYLEMLSRIKTRIERKRAKSFLTNIHAWHETCVDISEMMGGALHDQSIMKMDIGYIIETADRMLFHLRYYIPDSMGTLKRRNPELAQRFDNACQQIFHLRNETTIFLIRSQGPGPMSGDEPDDEKRMIYYFQALEQVGFNARDIKKNFDRDLKFIWSDMQKVIVQEEIIAKLE